MIFFRILKKLIFGHTRTIHKKVCTKLTCYIVQAGDSSAKEQIIQYDKIYHHILKELGYIGTFGEILKRQPDEIKNLQEIWELHKLRNSLVHELKQRDDRALQKEAKRYRIICDTFVKQVTK